MTRDLGDTRPLCSRNGRRLFYRTGETSRSKMMAVTVTETREGLSFGEPEELFDKPYAGTTNVISYDVASDGRFVMIPYFEHATHRVTEINVILNWFEELKRLVPTGR